MWKIPVCVSRDRIPDLNGIKFHIYMGTFGNRPAWPAATNPTIFSPQKEIFTTHKTLHFAKQATFFRLLPKISSDQNPRGSGVQGGNIGGRRPAPAWWCRLGGELVIFVGLLLAAMLAPARTAIAEEIRGDDLAPLSLQV
jgi:hypothetical protein